MKTFSWLIVAQTPSELEQWQTTLTDCPQVKTQVTEGAHFDAAKTLDIEILATSLVVVKFSLAAPHEEAAVYHHLPLPLSSATVIVPPAFSLKHWPEALEASLPRPQTSEEMHAFVNTRPAFLYQWRKVLEKTLLEIERSSQPHLRVGFHVGRTSLGHRKDEENSLTFSIAFAEMREQATRRNLKLVD